VLATGDPELEEPPEPPVAGAADELEPADGSPPNDELGALAVGEFGEPPEEQPAAPSSIETAQKATGLSRAPAGRTWRPEGKRRELMRISVTSQATGIDTVSQWPPRWISAQARARFYFQ